jgi:hypothetical protein
MGDCIKLQRPLCLTRIESYSNVLSTKRPMFFACFGEFLPMLESRPRISRPVQPSPTLKLLGLLLLGLGTAARPKDPPINAIVLFDDANGAAYVQATGVTVNNRTELRSCDGVAQISKKTYGQLPKVSLRGAKSLDILADGQIALLFETKPVCALPSGISFDNKAEFSAAEAARQATIQGTVVSSSAANQSGVLPLLKPGVRVVFVVSHDLEYAEYLRAVRANTVPVWIAYLDRFAKSAHASEAKTPLATLYSTAGDSALAAYRKSVTAHAPDLAQLKAALTFGEKASKTADPFPPAKSLMEEVRAEMSALVDADKARLQAYHQALNARTPGYTNLTDAQKHNEQVVEVNPTFEPALSLKKELDAEAAQVNTTLQNATTLTGNKNFDEALKVVHRYIAFASEVPQVQSIIDSAFDYHFSLGKAAEEQSNWQDAVVEYRKAAEIKSTTSAAAALKNAEEQLTQTRNHSAADKAILESQDFIDQKDFIGAYMVFEKLPSEQRALVEDRRSALRNDFVDAAFQRALKLQELHVPIKGRADEDSVRQAYELLFRAAPLTEQPGVKLKLDLLSETISKYYVAEAKRYLEKPNASGVGLGWYFLDEAKQYKPDLEVIRDEKNRYQPQFQIRSYLSVAIEFRDQTSRRDAAGYAEQLADAIATRLEAAGIKIHRPSDPAPIVPNNFIVVGEIVQDRVNKVPKQESLQSKYRAGTREVPNEKYTQATHDLEAAGQVVKQADQNVERAQGRNKKKEIEDAKAAAAEARKKQEELRNRRDALEPSVQQDFSKTYNYSKTTYDIDSSVELGFRITDRSGNVIEPMSTVPKQKTAKWVMVENVNAEDTEGVKLQDKTPDEKQMREELEIQARDELVKKVQEKIAALPEKILAAARSRVKENDLDAAAEQYVLYLNATNDDAPSRDEAIKFLQENFNVFKPAVSVS